MNVNYRQYVCLLLLLIVVLLLVVGLAMAKPQLIEETKATQITIASATDRDSQSVSMNADGTMFAFQSDSDFYVHGIQNDQYEIWLYNTIELTFTRVTTASSSERDSWSPILNDEGTFLTFSSDSDFLSQGIGQGQIESWLYELSTKNLTRLTIASDTTRKSWAEDINSSGSIVAISSDSDFNNEGIVEEQFEIWLYNTTVPTLTRMTHASEPNRQSFSPSLNGDGTLVVFSSDSDFMGQGIIDEQSEIWLYDTTTKDLTRVTTASDSNRASFGPSMSADGTRIAFLSDSDFHGQGILDNQYEIWLYDVTSGVLTRVTTTPGGNGYSDFPYLNSDGSCLVFHGYSDLLNEGLPSSQFEIWQYQVATSQITRITYASDFQRDSLRPVVNSDGTMVAFEGDSDFNDQGNPQGQYEIWFFELAGPGPKLNKTVSETFPVPGQIISFTIHIENPLEIDLTDVVISDTMPLELNFLGPVTMEPYQSGAHLASVPGDLPTLGMGIFISAGKEVTLTFPVQVDERVDWGTTITNTASIVSKEIPDPTRGSIAFDVVFHVTSVNPAQNLSNAPHDTNLTIYLNDLFDRDSINFKTIIVNGGFHGQMNGLFTPGSIIFNPDTDLFPGELVQTSITAKVNTIGGDPLTPFVWEFHAAAGPGPGVFIPHPVKHYLPTFQTTEAAMGDLDGDGDLDVILASSQHQSVWMNDGSGFLTSHFTSPTFGSGRGRAISLGDMDKDGDLDAVVTKNVTDTIWLNDGNGVMTSHPFTPVFDMFEGYDNALGDIDGDGDLDVVVARKSGGCAVWVNDGKGNLSQHSTTPTFGSGDSFDIEIGDVDNDGDLDVLVAYIDMQPILVWENDGRGNFRVLSSFGSYNNNGLAVGDLDGDGDLDAIVTRTYSAATVWINNGFGQFSPHPVSPSFGVDAREVTLGDIDGDGDLDAILPRSDQLSQTVWLNDGAGNFSPPSQFAEFGGGYTMQVALGDLDGDGDLDAVLTDNSSLDTSIWLNHIYHVMLPLVLRD